MKRFLLLSLLFMMIGSACAPTSEAEVAADTSSDAPAGCLSASAQTELLQHEAFGYCMLFPADYQVRNFEDNVVELVLDSPLNDTDPRLIMKIEPANGRSAEQVADDFFNQLPADFVAEFNIERSTVDVNGATGYVIDNLPEQTVSRYVFVSNGDLLYSMTFSPVDAAGMDSFYSDALASMRFVPVAADAALDVGNAQLVRDGE